MLIRSLLLFTLVAAVTALAILLTIQLPEIALLRYVVLAAPIVGAAVVLIEWYDLGAPSPLAAVQGQPVSAP